MPWSESLPQFSLAGTLLTVLLLFFAAFGEPLLGRRAFAWLSRSREGDARALGLLYTVTMVIHVLWGLMVLVVLLLSPALNLVDLGLRSPDAFGPVIGGALGGLAALAAFWVLANGLPGRGNLPFPGKLGAGGSKRGGGGAPGEEDGAGGDGAEGRGRRGRGHRGSRGRRGQAKPMVLPQPGRQQHLLLPRTPRERGLAAGMAVTAGVFGELLYRGLFITLVASMGVPLWIAALLSILLFSVAHVYQGWWGLLSAGFSGTLFTVLYLGTGSLIVPVLVHVALNLRSVVFAPASEREALEGGYHQASDKDDYYEDEYDDEYDGAYDEGARGGGYGSTGEFEAVGEPAPQGPPQNVHAPSPPPQGPPPSPGPGHGHVPQGPPPQPSPGPAPSADPFPYPHADQYPYAPPGPQPDRWANRGHSPGGDTPGPGSPPRD